MEETAGAPDFDRLKKIFEGIPHNRELGMRVVAIESGAAVIALDYQERLVGNVDKGHLHGGVVTTLLDTVGGLAVMSALPGATTIATLDLRIDYLRPATPGETVLAHAECYKLTRNVAFLRGTAYHQDKDDPIATCVATYMTGSAGFAVPGPVAGEGAGKGGKA